MLEYLITFGVSGAVAACASRAKERRTKAFLCLLSVIPLCLLAGLRAPSVGVDTDLYPLFTYQYSIAGNISQTFAMIGGGIEPVYVVYSWIVSNLFKSFNALLFFLQLAVAGPVALMLYKRYPDHIGTGMLVYSALFFGFSLNIMRQSAAVAFVLLSYAAAKNGSVARFSACILLAAGFHLTGLLGVLVWPLVRMHERIVLSKQAGETLVRVALIAGCLFATGLTVSLALGDHLVSALSSVKSTYSAQVGSLGITNKPILALAVGQAAISTFLCYVGSSRKEADAYRHERMLLLLVVWAGAALSALTLVTSEAYRLGFSLLIFCVPLFAVCAASARSSQAKVLVYSIIGVDCLAFFLIAYVGLGLAGIVPYSMQIV